MQWCNLFGIHFFFFKFSKRLVKSSKSMSSKLSFFPATFTLETLGVSEGTSGSSGKSMSEFFGLTGPGGEILDRGVGFGFTEFC